MAGLLYQLYSFTSLLTLGLYHLISTTRLHHLSPHSFTAKPFHSLPFLTNHPRIFLRNLPQLLVSLCLLIALLHHLLLNSFTPDPLLKGASPVHTLLSLQASSILLLFLLITLSSLLLIPHSLVFIAASAAYYLLFNTSSSASSLQTSALESKCDSVFALIAFSSAMFTLVLSIKPKLYLADVGLSASVILQGFWALQTGLILYVDAFIPDGCHKLLDVVSGVEGSTKCELEESKLRAVAILDLMFVVYVMVVVVVVMVVYLVTGKVFGGSGGARRSGSYEVLPTVETNSVQMKTLTGTQE